MFLRNNLFSLWVTIIFIVIISYSTGGLGTAAGSYQSMLSSSAYNNVEVDDDRDEDDDDDDDLEVLSFCPNLLIKHLMSRVDAEEVLETSKSTFHAACMLVDISGFSSFSGSMCSKVLRQDHIPSTHHL